MGVLTNPVGVTVRGNVIEVEFDPQRRRELEIERIWQIAVRGLRQTAETLAAINRGPR